MSEPIRIELQFRTPSQNEWQRWHFHRQRKFKKTVVDLLTLKLFELGVFGQHRASGPRKLVVTRYSPQWLDRGNFIGGCKAILDALRDIGAIRDDAPQWLVDEYHQVKAPRADKRTVIELTEVAS